MCRTWSISMRQLLPGLCDDRSRAHSGDRRDGGAPHRSPAVRSETTAAIVSVLAVSSIDRKSVMNASHSRCVAAGQWIHQRSVAIVVDHVGQRLAVQVSPVLEGHRECRRARRRRTPRPPPTRPPRRTSPASAAFASPLGSSAWPRCAISTSSCACFTRRRAASSASSAWLRGRVCIEQRGWVWPRVSWAPVLGVAAVRDDDPKCRSARRRRPACRTRGSGRSSRGRRTRRLERFAWRSAGGRTSARLAALISSGLCSAYCIEGLSRCGHAPAVAAARGLHSGQLSGCS